MRTLAAVFLFFLSFTTLAQTFDRDVQFYIKNSARLLKVKQTADNNYLIYGWFDYYGSEQTGSLVKVDVHGDPVFGFKPLSPKYQIRDLVVLPTGKILISTGDLVDGGPLLRLNADGSIDQTFTPDPSLNFVTFALQSTGKIIAITYEAPGSYTLRRLNANGTTDTPFAPGTVVNFPTHIAVAPDDRIYVDPTTFTADCFMIRLTANGTQDNTFSFWRTANRIDNIKVRPDGKVLVEMQSINASQFACTVEQLTETGASDPNFTPYVVPADIRAMVIRNNGKILVGGGFLNNFTTVAELNANGTYSRAIATTNINAVESIFEDAAGGVFVGGEFEQINSKNNERLARLYPDFQIDDDFKHKAFYTGDIDNRIRAQSDGKLLIWGGTPAFKGVGENSSGFIRLTEDFQPDPTFVHPLDIKPGFLTRIHSVAVQEDNKIVVGGRSVFPGFKHFGRLKPDGELDDSFNIGTGPAGNGADAWVENVIYKNSKLYVAGRFDSWNGTPGSLLVILDKDGNRIGPANPILPPLSKFSRIYHMAIQSDGKIILRGNFPFDAGTKEFIRLNADGSLDNTFTTVLASSSFSGMAVDPGTDEFYISGNAIDGVSGRALARYSKEGVRDVSFNGEGFEGYPQTVAVTDDGLIVTGGVFSNKYKGANSPGLVIVDRNGTRVPYGVEFVKNPLSYDITILNDDIYVVGRFVNADDNGLSSVKKIEMGDLPQVSDNITSFEGEAISASTIVLTWKGEFGHATRIMVERSKGNESNYQQVALLLKSDTTYADPNLDPSTKYYYKITGRNALHSTTHASVNVTTLDPTAVPPAPVALPAESIGVSFFTGRWQYPAGADSVEVELSKNNFTTILKKAATDDPYYPFTGLEEGGQFKYRVRQFQEGVASTYSNVITVTLVAPEKINSLTATVTYPATVTLNWDGEYPLAEAIEISASPNDDAHYSVVATLTPDKKSREISQLSEATKYYFKVTVKAGLRNTSKTISATTPVKLVTVLQPTEITYNSFKANWEYVAGTDSVLLQVSKDNFATFLPGFDKKLLKVASLKLENLEEGKTYNYRLKRFRNGLSSDFSTGMSSTLVLGVEEATEVLVYPNPVVDYLSIKEGEQFGVLNAQGKEVYVGISNGSFDMREYPAGLYLIKIGPKVFRIIKL